MTITIKGSKVGTETDENGKFTLDVQPGQVLVFSFVGYQDQELVVGDTTTVLNVQLNKRNAILEEVVVSYGTQKRREVTGAISSIDANK